MNNCFPCRIDRSRHHLQHQGCCRVLQQFLQVHFALFPKQAHSGVCHTSISSNRSVSWQIVQVAIHFSLRVHLVSLPYRPLSCAFLLCIRNLLRLVRLVQPLQPVCRLHHAGAADAWLVGVDGLREPPAPDLRLP